MGVVWIFAGTRECQSMSVLYNSKLGSEFPIFLKHEFLLKDELIKEAKLM